MKKKVLIITAGIFTILSGYGQSSNDVLQLLTQKNVVTQQEADSIRADASIKQQETDAKKKTFPVIAGKGLLISGFTQVRYQFLEQAGKVNGFDIRRARLDFKSNLSSYWGYKVQVELAGAPKLLEAYGELKLNDYLNFTLGQFKVPYSLEGLTSTPKLEFIDGSQVVDALTGRKADIISATNDQQGYDIGLQAGGSFLKIKDLPLIEYKVGIFNGTGPNIADNLKEKDVVGRLVFHPIKGIDFGGFAYKGYAFYNTKSSKTTVDAVHERNRYGIEVSAEYKGASLRAEYIEGKDGNKLRNGYYVSAGYFILPQQLQVLAKLDNYDPNINKAVIKDNLTNYTGVINYYFNPNTRIQLGYTVKKEQAKEIKNNQIVVQFQLGF
jgi:phosphate-selective porin OprO and OprP